MNAATADLPLLKQNWTRLAQIAVWISSIVVTFLATPPRQAPPTDADAWISMAQFLLALVLGLMIPSLATRRAKVANSLRIASVICLVVGLSCFFVNKELVGRWTCPYYDGRGPMIVGTTLSAEAVKYLRMHPQATCTSIIQDFAGGTREIWQPAEISNRHTILAALFLATLLSFSLSAILMLESLPRPRRTEPAR